MRAGELFEGVVNSKIPKLDYNEVIEKVLENKGEVTIEMLEKLFSEFSWYLQEYADKILDNRKSDSELLEDYRREENEKWRNLYLVQEYFQDAGLNERQKDSILEFAGYLHGSIEHNKYLASGKATMGELTRHTHKKGLPNSFFYDVQKGKINEFEWYMRIKELTDNFDPDRLESLCYNFDFYFWWEKELWEGSFTQDELNRKVHEMIENGDKVPMLADRKRRPIGTSSYLKRGRKKYKLKKSNKGKVKDKERDKFWDETLDSLQKISRETVDEIAVMDPKGEYFGQLYNLQTLLVDLLVKHTDAERNERFDYRSRYFEDVESTKSKDSFNPFEINFNSENSETFRFFELVSSGELPKLDIQNKVQDLTSNYNEDKLKLLTEEFDRYIFVKYENWRSAFTQDYIEQLINKSFKEERPLPKRGEKKYKHHWLFVRDFFLRTRFGKPISDEEFENQMDELFGADRKNSDVIDDNVLLGGFYYATQSRSLLNLRDILIELNRKHTDAVYKFDDQEPQFNNIQPIHWLKDEFLRQFLDSLKSAGLIENRDTEEIIQEHFRESSKKPLPIKWSKSNRLINYLFWQLREAGLIDKERKFKIIAEHFLNRHGKPLKSDSLKSDIEEIKYNSPKGSKVIDNIIESLQTKPLQ